MSVAYYIVLENDDAGFDPFVNGKALAKEAGRVNELTERLGINPIDEFVEVDDELFGESADPLWFEPQTGIEWAHALVERLRADAGPVEDAAAVVSDLEECLAVWKRAKEAGVRWHFAIDY
jgi:hypothetical protein